MLNVLPQAIIAAVLAAAATPLMQAIAIRHVLMSRNALNVEGRDIPGDAQGPLARVALVPGELLRGRGRETFLLAAAGFVLAMATMLVSPFFNVLSGWASYPYAALWGVATAILLVNGLTDLRHWVLPHLTNLSLAGVALVMALLRPLALPAGTAYGVVWVYLGTGIALFLIFLAMEATGRSGGGDTKTIVGYGFLLGYWVLPALVWASVAGLAYQMVSAPRSRRAAKTPNGEDTPFLRKKLPYGPFLVVGLYFFMLTFDLNVLLFQAYMNLAFRFLGR